MKKIMEITREEQKALDHSINLWNSLLNLETIHPDDIHEFRRDIHNIQNRIMSRPFRKGVNKQTKTKA